VLPKETARLILADIRIVGILEGSVNLAICRHWRWRLYLIQSSTYYFFERIQHRQLAVRGLSQTANTIIYHLCSTFSRIRRTALTVCLQF